MTGGYKIIYEVLSYRDSENPQDPSRRDITTRKKEALKISSLRSREFPLVETGILEYLSYYGEDNPDDNNLNGEIGLLCSFRDGKRVA